MFQVAHIIDLILCFWIIIFNSDAIKETVLYQVDHTAGEYPHDNLMTLGPMVFLWILWRGLQEYLFYQHCYKIQWLAPAPKQKWDPAVASKSCGHIPNHLFQVWAKLQGYAVVLTLFSYSVSVYVGYEYNNCPAVIWEVQATQVSGHDMSISEIGGWNLDIHHRYNFHEGTSAFYL